MRQRKNDAHDRHDDAQASSHQRHEQVVQFAPGFGRQDRQPRLQDAGEPEEQPEHRGEHAEIEQLVKRRANACNPSSGGSFNSSGVAAR